MQETTSAGLRFRLIPLIAIFAGLSLLALLIVSRLAPPRSAGDTLPATAGPLESIQVDALGLSMLAPSSWRPPSLLDNNRFVLSPDGSTDTRTTAGPFLYVVVDALPIFRQQLNFRDDYTEPTVQLDALVDALNRNGPRFKASEPYPGSAYPGAIVRGFERGNEVTIVLLRADDGRWIYIGAQDNEQRFPFYEQTVFLPVTNSIRLLPR